MCKREETISLNEGIFFRKYEEECYVWNTKTQRVYEMNSVAYDIFKMLKNMDMTVNTIIQTLKEEYEFSEGMKENVSMFVEELLSKGLLGYSNSQKEKFDFEQVIATRLAQKHILYGIMFELTYKCNERCKHCYVDVNESVQKELTTEEVFKIIDQFDTCNIANVTFSGGDIFTRSDAMEIIEYTVKKNIMVDIFSNGIALTDEMIYRLSDLHIRSFQCSIYGKNAETHDKITGIVGSFEKSMHVLKVFKLLGVPINIKIVLMKDNISEYSAIMELVDELDASYQVSTSIRPSMRGETFPTHLRASEQEIRAVLQSELSKISEEEIDENYEKMSVCNAGFNSLLVNPYGDVYLCASLGNSLGNLKKNLLSDIWEYSEEIKIWRTKTLSDIEGCQECKVRKYCAFCPSQAFLETGKWNCKYDEICRHANLINEIKGGV